MSNTLIIDARHELSLSQKLICNSLTLALWSLWLYLCMPAIGLVIHLSGFKGFYRQMVEAQSLWPHLPHALLSFLLIQLGAASLLAIWATLTRNDASNRALPPDVHEYAKHFGLDGQQLRDARKHAITVVHHDEQGQIIRLESKPAA